jgi:hypothetical protein
MVFDAPSRWIRVCALPAILLVASMALATRTATAHSANLGPQVRTSDAVIRALLTEAADRSRTFRRLIETIDASDVIVYVEWGHCGHGVRACLAMSVTPAGTYRILRILVDVRDKPRDLMASIGHELRHVIEVLENRAVVDAATAYLFYAQGSFAGSDRPFETHAAIETGFAVRNEIESSFNAGR